MEIRTQFQNDHDRPKRQAWGAKKRKATLTSYGPRLSFREYEQRMIALHDDSRWSGPRGDAMIRRQELELSIDHKLGLNFPKDRRDALWKAQQRVHRRHVPVLLTSILGKAFGSKKPLDEALARLVQREYGRVLEPDELTALLDIEAE